MTGTSEATSARGWGGFLLILIALMVEGFDLQAANFAAPSILEDFGVGRAEIGPLLSASLFGVLIGAVFIGPQGDRLGRRTILISCCIGYGIMSLVGALATNLTQLIVLRFLIGIGLGAVLPNALALAGELAPRKYLARATALVGIGITFGGVLAGIAAAKLLAPYGWQSLFILGGLLPIAIAALLWIGLPESPVLNRAQHPAPGERGLSAILSPAQRARTIAIWIIFALVLMVVYLVSGWVPLLVKDQGYSTTTASWIATGTHAGGVVGGVVASLLLVRRNWSVVALFAGLGALTLAIITVHDWGIVGLTVLLVLVGLFSTGTQNGLNGSCGATYPATMRASGLGWALGMGRVGSIAGPLVGSLAVLLGLSAPRTFFILPVIPLVIAAALALWLARRTGPAAPETSAQDSPAPLSAPIMETAR
ncbi:AAHS family 4-hydroxybenzoate transporter-like MFS transporter [Sphingobium sp. B2D3A]|uniref:MFS transporter n=1 Tax=unclassified Sphingobium TaxID=2611147 RepID=UPI002224A699|nr:MULTISPECIES: MFS transporter [unclassified Sphingobium]MCW2335891.1 AAHS family 4-hydroxybenzoate transporter-like MFS transporter [Sphingobium sp. B2D3A]MCW2385650.1 AAHS family 4-hydroxybenzoate transporter-like MFS transporter [Sphingobium sp. B2D3D]MCW2390215.1 AAHS family 4-hydroxybenzoate transporter-like MFS transporter [Sphingobium sp. B11D3B]